MCKKVREINGIPQYEYCDEYKEAKREFDNALEEFKGADWNMRHKSTILDGIRKGHQPEFFKLERQKLRRI